MRQLTVKNTEPKTPVPSKEPASLPSEESIVMSAMAPEFAREDPRPWARKGYATSPRSERLRAKDRSRLRRKLRFKNREF